MQRDLNVGEETETKPINYRQHSGTKLLGSVWKMINKQVSKAEDGMLNQRWNCGFSRWVRFKNGEIKDEPQVLKENKISMHN